MGKITKISELNSFLNIIKNLDSNSLVIFDIDEVIIMPEDNYLLTHPYRQEIINDSKQKYDFEHRKYLFSIIMSKQKMRLVDEKFIEIFECLKQNSLSALGLTKSFTGRFGIIDKAEDILLKHLDNLGIDFKQLAPLKANIEFKELANKDGTPLFMAGILMTAMQDKGKILKHFMDASNYFAKKIIFIDDKIENLQSVADLCDELTIEGDFYHYDGAQNIEKLELDFEQEKLRFKILEDEYMWLNNEELIMSKKLVAENNSSNDIYT